jgi:putative spermidine/putrescine transport system substrate-binding protein
MAPYQTRRTILGGLAGAAALGLSRASAQTPASPLALNIVDVAGNLALTQPAFELYRREKPKMVSRITYSQAPAPELPGKIRAQQNAGRVDIDLVLTGTDGLAAGIDQKLWVKLFPDHADALPNLEQVCLPGAYKMQGLAQGQGMVVSYCPGGPLIEYNPDKVKQPPATIQDLLAWAQANPKRFMYARPANSGPGRAFLMGVPYLLGDSNPRDPDKGWDKTWSFLAALGDTIEYYPSGTGALMKELGEGSRDMVPTMTGWDINPRALGVVPENFQVTALKGFHFVADAHYAVIPNGVSAERLAVLLDLCSFLLTKPAQAFAYDRGYFYPGPVAKDVPLSMAPQQSQDDLSEFGRPFYDKLIADTPIELPLDAPQLVFAFNRWDKQIGAPVKQ